MFLPESERKGGDTNDSVNKDEEKEDSNANKLRGKQVVDSEDIPLAALVEEDNPEDIPFATLEAKLLKLVSENDPLDKVMAQLKKATSSLSIVYASQDVSNAQEQGLYYKWLVCKARLDFKITFLILINPTLLLSIMDRIWKFLSL